MIWKPLGWLLWKFKLAIRVIEELSDSEVYIDDKVLKPGKDYTVNKTTGHITFDESLDFTGYVHVRSTVKQASYYWNTGQ
jgi:hypothetical protein